MGMEFEVTSLEDMCSLMCDNAIPKKKRRQRMTTKEHEEFTHNLYSVVTPLGYAYTDALKRGVEVERLAVGMTRRLYEKLLLNTNTQVYDDGSVFLAPLMVGSHDDCGATMLGLPVIILGDSGDDKCWLMEAIDLLPTRKEESEAKDEQRGTD